MSKGQRPVGAAHRTQHGQIARGSQRHEALRLLSAQDLSTEQLSAIAAVQRPMPRDRYQVTVLDPLRELGLVIMDRSTRPARWCITDEGAVIARRLGPFGAAEAANDPGTSPITAHPAPLAIEQAPCRRRLTLGTGDRRPPMHRPGSEVAAALPSRVGGWLHWPDGRRTPA